jgi:aryl-alcohol dehydrogenase-like predicted oxidoreductase|uniref:Aldo/keto reductase n=1 Tax=Desulfobacca acetoxidans TaxID=60893 RepID=A0A7C5EWE3_9BACT
MSLPTRILGQTGVQVTIVGLGGEGVLRTFGYEREALEVIKAALEAGLTYFETARAYSGSEVYLGKGLGRERHKVFLSSKSHARSRREAEEHLSLTLGNLRTDYLDLWQVHDVRSTRDLEELAAPGGALETFRWAREEGYTRFVGVTGHHNPEVLRRALELYPFDTVLLPVNPAEPRYRSFLPVAQEAEARGLGVIGMKVLARGLVAQLDLAPIQDYLHYALSQPVSLVVVGCDQPQHVWELAEAARNFKPLPPEAQRRLEEAVAPFARGLMYYKP